MAKRPFIPIPPPAPLPEAENITAEDIAGMLQKGETDLICIMGPTASGKTACAVRLAHRLRELLGRGVEILSADSRQIYRGMDIGTGKDLEEYGDIPYHLIDIAEPGERYNICRYQQDFSKAYSDCLRRGVIPILCGGSGLYVEAVTKKEYDFGTGGAGALTFPLKPCFLAIIVDRDTRRARIDRRLDERLAAGMIEEVRELLKTVPAEILLKYGLEYKFVTQYILGEISLEYMREHLAYAIHQFAKRQMTWLRGMEKDGLHIHWVAPQATQE